MKKLLCILLVFALAVPVLVACSTPAANNNENDNNNGDEVKFDANLKINVSVLSGTTGMGMAKLIDDKKDGAAALNYNFSVVADATAVAPLIISGQTDIAAVPTNLASTLYKRTEGGIYILAINTLGVLYLLENGETVNTIADLKGKTVYLPGTGTNPEYILKQVIEANDLKVGTDVIFDYTYGTPDALAQAVTGGLAGIALLPEPKVTVVMSNNSAIRTALDITEEWDKVNPKGSLAQGCVIVRKAFADEHPAEIAKFLEEYKASVNFVNASKEEAAQLIADAGIIPKAPRALKAIPNCNITYVDGEAMKTALTAFYDILFKVNPAAVGGAVPDAAIYYVK